MNFGERGLMWVVIAILSIASVGNGLVSDSQHRGRVRAQAIQDTKIAACRDAVSQLQARQLPEPFPEQWRCKCDPLEQVCKCNEQVTTLRRENGKIIPVTYTQPKGEVNVHTHVIQIPMWFVRHVIDELEKQ